MKLFRLLFIAAFMMPLALTANNELKGKHTEEKKIKREFSVNSNANLVIKNSYGNVDIVSWEENRIEIEVTIKTSGNDLKKVREKLDEIDVQFVASPSSVAAETKFSKGKWRSSNNISMRIDYLIKMPVGNSLVVDNNYGAVSLNKLQGNVTISCNYGKLILGELLGERNVLSFDYTSGSTIGFVKNATISADYSGFVIDKSENVTYKGDYTSAEIKEVKNLTYSSDYGKISVHKAEEVSGKGSYIAHNFGTIGNRLVLVGNYGSININKLEKKAVYVSIKSKYTGIKIGHDADMSFALIASLSYATIKEAKLEDYKIETINVKNSNNKEITGFYGSRNSETRIVIDSSYGNVTFAKK